MTTDNDNFDSQYQELILLHVGELREKTLAAVGTPCPVCSEALRMASFMPWLICSNNHRIRPWTEAELEVMEKATPDLEQLLSNAAASPTVHRTRKRKEKDMREY